LRRSDDERLVHFARRADSIFAEPALQGEWGGWTTFEQETVTSTITEPRREDVRSLVIDLRKLDAPSEDLFLPGIIDLLLERATDPRSVAGLEEARRDYETSQGVPRWPSPMTRVK
jgi:hypothetical protein